MLTTARSSCTALRPQRGCASLLALVAAGEIAACKPLEPRVDRALEKLSPGLMISDESPVDDAVIGAALPGSFDASLGTDGASYLGVWHDQQQLVFAARVSAQGTPLDPTEIPLGRWGHRIRVAFDGTNYLVVWGTDQISAVRVTPQGTVLDVPPIQITDTSGFWSETDPSVTFNGTDYLVTWTRIVGNPRQGIIRGAFVSPDGMVRSSFAISAGTAAMFSTAACGPMNCTVVWATQDAPRTRMVHGARVRGDGTVLDRTPFTIPNAAIRLDVFPETSIAFDGARYLVVWPQDGLLPGTRFAEQPAGAFVSMDGMPGAPFEIAVPPGSASETVSVAFDGTSHRVFWTEAFGAYTARLDAAGHVSDRVPILPGTTAIACATAGCMTALSASSPRHAGEVRVARLSATGQPLDPAPGTLISLSANIQFEPRASFDGTNYLVAWLDSRNATVSDGGGSITQRLFAARVRPDRTPLDPSSIPISSEPISHIEGLAFDGTNHLALYVAADLLWARRISGSGALLDQAPILISPVDYSHGDVTFDGVNYFVVWHHNAVLGARISPAGVVLDDPPIRLFGTSQVVYDTRVAFNGTNHLVVWSDATSIRGTRVSPMGQVLDTPPFEIRQNNPTRVQKIASDGADFLVLWEGSGIGVQAARVSGAGFLLDPQGVDVALEGSGNPSAVWSPGSSRYLVVWGHNVQGPNGWTADIFGTYVRTATAVVVDRPTMLLQGLERVGAIALAREPRGAALLAYSRYDPSPGFVVNRVRVRTIDELAAPPPDSGVVDAREEDVAAPDVEPTDASGAHQLDAEAADAGTSIDASSSGARGAGSGGGHWGCACIAASGRRPDAALVLLLAAVSVLGSRRRRAEAQGRCRNTR